MDAEAQAPKKKKAGYTTNTQMRRLIELLDADPQLRSGKFSPTFTHKIAQNRWCEISNELNAIGGAHKTWFEWRKSYQDKRTKTKSKASGINRSSVYTGGGGPEKKLDEDEQFLLSTISSAAVSGHSDSKESNVVFKDLTNCSNTVNVHPLPSTSDSLKIDMTGDVTTHGELFTCLDVDIEEIDLTKDAQQNNQSRQSDKIEMKPTPKRKSTLKKSLEAATALQTSLQEKNNLKKQYYEKKLELLTRKTKAIEMVAWSFSVRANPYI